MSLDIIKGQLEARLMALTGGIAAAQTQFPNLAFEPSQGTPYQRVWHIIAPPFNFSGMSARRRYSGIFQVDLCYPYGAGEGAADAAAKALEAWFYQGLSITSNSVTTRVDRTPETLGGRLEGDRWILTVKITWFCNT